MKDTPENPFSAVCDIVQAFHQANISYLIGGSVASSLFGRFRTTNDIDCLCVVSTKNIEEFLESLKNGFILDDKAVRSNLLKGRSYNIIHESTFVKVDLFPAKSAFHQEELRRATEINPPSCPCSFRVATAEDIILAKLSWLKKSSFSSERQWSDLEGIVAVSAKQIDKAYLYRWATELGVEQALKKLLKED